MARADEVKAGEIVSRSEWLAGGMNCLLDCASRPNNIAAWPEIREFRSCMTDQREGFPTYNDGTIVIKYDDMLRFMNAKFSSTTCIQCGENDGWTVDTGNTSEYDPTKLTIYKMEYATGINFRPFVAISCNNCATIRQMSANTIDEWIRNNPETSE